MNFKRWGEASRAYSAVVKPTGYEGWTEPSDQERLTRLVLRSEGLLRRVARVRPTSYRSLILLIAEL